MNSSEIKKGGNIAILGLAILFSGILITAFFFEGRQGESYSIFRFFISALGMYEVSQLAIVYNSSVILSGICLFTFVWKMRSLYDYSPLGKIAHFIGCFATLNFIVVGMVPGDYLQQHIIVAITFFTTLSSSIFLYSLVIFKDERSLLPKGLFYIACLIVCALILFLVLPKELLHEKRADPDAFIRPEFWILPSVEWLLFFLAVAWLLTCSISVKNLKV